MLVVGAPAVWPHGANAQQQGKIRTVGFVLPVVRPDEMAGSDPSQPVARAFIHGLRDLGWVEGRNITIFRRTAEGQAERAPAIIGELVARGVDVIALGAAGWLHEAARRATQTIPLVALFNEDPVARGLVASLARPSGNLTGVSALAANDQVWKRIQLLRELAPEVNRIAYLGSREGWKLYQAAAEKPLADVFHVQLESPDRYAQAFAEILRGRAQALTVHGPAAYLRAAQIAAFAAQHRLPAIFGLRHAVDLGGLISYGPSASGYFTQLARVVDRILKGARPSELPVELPTRFDLVINLKAAKALRLVVPDSMLVRADEVIE